MLVHAGAPPSILYSSDEVLELGLSLIRYGGKRMKRVSQKTNIKRFHDGFGVSPVVYAQIWEDLQTTKLTMAGPAGPEPVKIDTTRRSCTLKTFLQSIHFLKKYDTECDRAGQTGNCDTFCRTWSWYFLKRVAALKGQKIIWPAHWSTDFIISLDGVHCRFHEVKHPTFSKDPSMFSHKYNGPGVGYELALSLFTDQLVWLKGPTPAGNSDQQVYKRKLKKKVPKGKKVIVDGGYSKNKKKYPELSTPNAHDAKELRLFKGRAKDRQEAFHSRIKRFEAVSVPFRHSMDRHKVCFEAICVICQYEMELVSPLFDV